MQRLIRVFSADRQGGLAVVFCLTLVVSVAVIGLAVDTGRAMNTSSILRSALDGASLVAAKAMVEQDLTDAEVEAIARRALRAQLETSGVQASHWGGFHFDIDREKGHVAIGVDMAVPTTFARVVNFKTISARMEGHASYKIRPSEVSLVLDVTGSMGNDNKLADMQAAAKEAVRTLLPADQPHLNRVAMAPYAAAVNAGIYAAAVSDGRSGDGCVVERAGANAFTDEDPTDIPGGPDWLKVEADTPPGPNPALPSPLDENNYDCPTASVMALTSARAPLEAAIDALTDDGYTGGHMGLAWGWYMLSPKWNAIFTGPTQPKPHGEGMKSIILMTDGDFNVSYLNGPLNETAATQAIELCNNIKSDGINLYTIGFALDKLNPPKDVTAAAMLLDCASEVNGAKQFYLASDGAALNAAFQEIVGKIQSLRLTD